MDAVLNNIAKDVIGSLRGTAFVVLIWRVTPLSFPLDRLAVEARAKRSELQDFARGFTETCRMGALTEEVLSAVTDDFLDTQGYYTEEVVDAQLSLYGDLGSVEHFPYGNKERLSLVTAPVFFQLLTKLTNSTLWARVASKDSGSSEKDDQNSLRKELFAGFQTLWHLVPNWVQKQLVPHERAQELRQAFLILEHALWTWRNSGRVTRGLVKTEAKASGLLSVVQEVDHGPSGPFLAALLI